MRHAAEIDALTRSVLGGEGTTTRALREAAMRGEDLPAEWRAWVEAVRTRAWEIEDRDVDALRRAGRSEEDIFEITVAAAVGEGRRRFELAKAAIDKVRW
jgi:uncharacterized protein (DUF2461 family)